MHQDAPIGAFGANAPAAGTGVSRSSGDSTKESAATEARWPSLSKAQFKKVQELAQELLLSLLLLGEADGVLGGGLCEAGPVRVHTASLLKSRKYLSVYYVP